MDCDLRSLRVGSEQQSQARLFTLKVITMPQIIELPGGGTAEFTDQYLEIDDQQSDRYHWLVLLSSFIWIPVSAYFMFRADFDFSQPMTWVWLLVLLVHLVGGRMYIFRTSFNERVWYNDVDSVKVTADAETATLVLYLKDGEQRRVVGSPEQAQAFRESVRENLRRWA